MHAPTKEREHALSSKVSKLPGKPSGCSADGSLDVVATAPVWRTTTDFESKETDLMAMKKATRKKAARKGGRKGRKKATKKAGKKGRRKGGRRKKKA